MEVFIYRAKGRGGYLYDLSLNPAIDYEILKKTRKIEEMVIVSQGLSIREGEEILRAIYGKSSIFGKFISSEDLFLNSILKKHGATRVNIRVYPVSKFPSLEDIGRVEELIIGKIVTVKSLRNIKAHIGIKDYNIEDIIQALYCERRIKMVPAVKRVKNKYVCFMCEKEACENCCYGFDSDDILLYAADNYSLNTPPHIEVNKRKLPDALGDAQREINSFIKSRKDMAIIWVAPNSFEYDILTMGIYEVIRRGGRVLYITSNLNIFESRDILRRNLEGARIEIISGYPSSFKDLDITLCAYSDYPCFYKAYDMVILDERYAFLESQQNKMYLTAKRASKERGKFIDITCTSDIKKRNLFKSAPEVIVVPVSSIKNPIPEPRIITSRFLDGKEPFIPPMAMDVIKWSLHQNMKTIIFVPDEVGVHRIYYYLAVMEGLERDIIDISSDKEKSALLAFKRGNCSILISTDFKDCIHPIENTNVIVMNSDDARYRADTLVNMAAMASFHDRKNLAEAVFVSQTESEAMSLAKSTIRGVNKIAWEKGYIKY